MKAYIAGKMSGLPGHGFDAFDKAAAGLRAMGITPLSPAEKDRSQGIGPNDPVEGELYAKVLMDDLIWIKEEADALVLLPQWSDSNGAKVEHRWAQALGLWISYPPGEGPEAVDG